MVAAVVVPVLAAVPAAVVVVVRHDDAAGQPDGRQCGEHKGKQQSYQSGL